MKVRRYLAAGMIALATALLAGCADVTSGTVEKKSYVPPYTWTYMQPLYGTRCSGSGSSFSCSTYVITYVPQQETDPECWRLDLLADNGKDKGDICVSEHSWRSVRVGTHWPPK